MPRKHMPFTLGGKRDLYDPRDYPYARATQVAEQSLVDTPLSPDVCSHKDKFYWCVPMWNQEREPACTGMALAALSTVLHALSPLGTEVTCFAPVVLSPRDAFEKALRYDEFPGVHTPGSSVGGALEGARKEGTCSWGCWPFKPNDKSGKLPEADLEALQYKLLRHERLIAIPEIEDAIFCHMAVIVTAMTHTGWIDPKAEDDYLIKWQRNYVDRGLHAFILNGYNRPGEYFDVHNSWGEFWADKGTAKLSYADFARNCTDAWLVYVV